MPNEEHFGKLHLIKCRIITQIFLFDKSELNVCFSIGCVVSIRFQMYDKRIETYVND